MEETGYCWYCGHIIKQKLFCNEKHKQQFERQRDRKIKRGKRAGYGIQGSCR